MLVVRVYRDGLSAEAIVESYPSRADAHACIAYYLRNRGTCDGLAAEYNHDAAAIEPTLAARDPAAGTGCSPAGPNPSGRKRAARGEPMPGVLPVRDNPAVAAVIEDLIPIAEASSPDDRVGRVIVLPFPGPKR